MASSIEVRRGRRHMRGMAVALGIMVLFAIAMIFMASAPGKELFAFQGSSGEQSVPGMGNLYSMDTMSCAFSMDCNLIG